VKNTLTKIAASEAGLEGVDALLTGPTAVAFINGEPVEAAKALRDFARTNPALVVKGGVMDGRALTADEVRKLADLESREVLLAKMAGALLASLSGRRPAVQRAARQDGPARRRPAGQGRAGPVRHRRRGHGGDRPRRGVVQAEEPVEPAPGAGADADSTTSETSDTTA
jgi:large subunit ribosomal protein L10